MTDRSLLEAGLDREAHALMDRLRPYVDSLICYASSIDEHPPNRLALDIDVYFRKRSWASDEPVCVNDGGHACTDCLLNGACIGEDPRAAASTAQEKES